MAASSKTCDNCGESNPPSNRFCAECALPLDAPTRDRSLGRTPQTQFSLPDYLLVEREREAAARRRRLAMEEGAGSGFVWTGAGLAVGALLFTSATGTGGWLFGVGLLMLLGGLWRLRADREAFGRVGVAVTGVGAVVLGGVLVQVLELRSAPRPEAPVVAEPPTPTPDPLEGTIAPVAFGNDVPMFRANPARTGEQAGPGPEGSPRRLWRVYTGGEVYASPIVVDGTVYVGTKSGFLLALDAGGGEERWRFDLGGYIVRGTPAVGDGAVYVSAGYALVAVDVADGSERWRVPIRFAGPASPLVADGLVYAGTQEGHVYAVDARSGREAWLFSTEGLIFDSPALAGGRLYVGDDSGQLYALDARTGRERWRATVGGDLYAAPAVGSGLVFVSTATPALVALDAETGEERWRLPIGGESSPALAGDRLVLGSEDNGVYAVDTRSGQPAWLFPTGQPVASSPAIVDGTVYVGTGTTLYALDGRSGDPVWGYPTGDTISSSPAVVNGVAYVGSHDGFLYAIGGTEDVKT